MSRGEPVAADADGEHRHRCGLQPEQRFGQRCVGRVGAVADEHHAGQRQAGQLLARAVERGAEPRLRAGERQVVGRCRAAPPADEKRNVRRTKRSDSALTSAASLPPNVCLTNAPRGWRSPVGDLHAARIVDQHREKILLRHRRLDDEDRDGTGRRASRASVAMRSAVSTTRSRTRPRADDPAVRRRSRAAPPRPRRSRRVRARRWRQAEFPLLENDRPVFEEKAEQRVHVVSGAQRLRPLVIV